MNKITSNQIKYELMFYFRFRRQWICATECNGADVMAITNDGVSEVEVKISKGDLWGGEAKKRKHPLTIRHEYLKDHIPNKFYICVPTYLEEEARKWVSETYHKYGIIRYNPEYLYSITIAKAAYKIHDKFSEQLKRDVMLRVCSENVGHMLRNLVKGSYQKNV